MERKDLLIAEAETPRPQIPQSEEKLSEVVEEAACLLQLVEGRGWKMLVTKWIEPRSSLSRILSQPGGRQRDEAVAAVAELTELKKYIDGRIEEGKKAARKLETLNKQRRT
jgi:hypothetical protein